jgi:predicted ATPase
MAQEGDLTGGIERMQEGMEIWKAAGWKVWHTFRAALLAQGLLLDERAEEGLEVIEEARPVCEGLEEACHEADVQRTVGDLNLGLPRPRKDEAEVAYRQAIAVALGQQARSCELRATTSLARLLRDTGRSDEAREMLGGIYGWFTEGFDTADMKDAEALLDELGSA